MTGPLFNLLRVFTDAAITHADDRQSASTRDGHSAYARTDHYVLRVPISTPLALGPRSFRAKREELGVSPGELAERLGVTRQTIYQWQGTHTPPPERRAEIAEALGVDIEEVEAWWD